MKFAKEIISYHWVGANVADILRLQRLSLCEVPHAVAGFCRDGTAGSAQALEAAAAHLPPIGQAITLLVRVMTRVSSEWRHESK
jgi:hypothetical protein